MLSLPSSARECTAGSSASREGLRNRAQRSSSSILSTISLTRNGLPCTLLRLSAGAILALGPGQHSANNTVNSGAILELLPGGTDLSAIITSGGTLIVAGGTASGTTILRGGTEKVASGGIEVGGATFRAAAHC